MNGEQLSSFAPSRVGDALDVFVGGGLKADAL